MSARPTRGERQTLQERFEASDIGRVLISAFLIVTLFAMLALNLPSSEIRRWVSYVGRPFAKVTSLEQAWTVFAPDPRNIRLLVSGRVTFADGTTTMWPGIDRGDPFFDQYRTHHWLKWAEWIGQDPFAGLWRSAAGWVAREYATPAHRPVRVTLIRRWRPIPPPGQPNPPWQTQEYYTLNVTATDLAGGVAK